MLGVSAHMDPVAETVLIVSGLCHDVGHPGRSNNLLVNAMDPLAILYNDRSVLENYHACVTFKTLEQNDCDIFLNLRSKVVTAHKSHPIWCQIFWCQKCSRVILVFTVQFVSSP